MPVLNPGILNWAKGSKPASAGSDESNFGAKNVV
jgi:hypothetical protein